MNKLHSIIRYECTTSFKYIWMFYAVQYAIVLFILSITNMEDTKISTLEINTLIYIGIVGVLGFKEEFKMLIQHGFTRKYIFTATLALFVFISGIMAIVDTIIGNVLHNYIQSYSSLHGSIYGYENIFMNFLWLFMLYLLVCSFSYLIVLIINKIGKSNSIYVSIVLGGTLMLVSTLYNHIISNEIRAYIVEFIMKISGIMVNGAVNYALPILTLAILVGILSICSYAVIHRTELK